MLYVRYWFIDLAFPRFKKLPLISIERSGKLAFKLVNYFELHRIQISIVFNEREPRDAHQNSSKRNEKMPSCGTRWFERRRKTVESHERRIHSQQETVG